MAYTDKNKLRVVYGDYTLGVHGEGFDYIFSYSQGGIESIVKKGYEWLYRCPKPTFWRALTDNDRGSRFHIKSGSWLASDMFIDCKKTEVIMDGELQKQYAPDNNSYGGDVAAGEIIVKYTYETVSNPVTTVIVSYAAKVYFNALFGLDFTRTAENSINAALNYGYSLLLSTCARETALNGYITQIGLFHDNIFNQFNLASDLMEPFRPIVDNMVKNMMPEKFEHDEKIEVLRLLQKEVIIAGRKECVNNAMKIYCRSIFDALNDDDISLIKFYKDEL